MRISDWSSDVCSSDLPVFRHIGDPPCAWAGAELRAGRGTPAFAATDRRRYRESRAASGTSRSDHRDRAPGGGRPAAPGYLPRLCRQSLDEIGRASCRERVWQNVSISLVAVSLQKKKIKQITKPQT